MVLHGDAWCCMVLHAAGWCCMVLHGAGLCSMVLHRATWCCMELHGTAWCAWCCMLLYIAAWWCMVLHGAAWWVMMLHGAVWWACFHYYWCYTVHIKQAKRIVSIMQTRAIRHMTESTFSLCFCFEFTSSFFDSLHEFLFDALLASLMNKLLLLSLLRELCIFETWICVYTHKQHADVVNNYLVKARSRNKHNDEWRSIE